MHLNKNHTFSRRALAMLLTLTLCFSLVPSAFAAQQNSYHDPAEHWMQASNRTNELDVNSVVTRETFKCGECGKVTSFEVFRVPEYTRNGQTALSRNVKYSDGTMMDGVGKGDCMDGVPGKDAHYTGYPTKLLSADPRHFRPALPGAWPVRYHGGRVCQSHQLCGMAAAVQRAAHISFHAGGGSADGYSGCQ